MFLVNSFPALVLIDSGSSQSLVSWSFNKDFVLPIEELEYLLRAFIANKHGVSASSIY